MKLKLVVDMELEKRDVEDVSTLRQDLEGELVKVKSGLYENRVYGQIVKVEIV